MLSKLKLTRMNAGIKQFEMAQKLGISPSELSNYERGVYRMPPERRYQIAKILSTTVDELFGEDY